MKYVLWILFVFYLFSVACNKDEMLTASSGDLKFSQDTVLFDTVFTTIGSTTGWFKVFNQNSRKINIASVALAGGASSQFRINVDGISGNVFSNVEIPAGDSIFIFVDVTVDPTSALSPFVVTDSVVFQTNGNIQDVQLVAWGQNAYFYNNASIKCNSIWSNDKPHVIYGIASVDSNCTLTVNAGVKIYSHSNSGLFVYGTLNINGTKDNQVKIEGDRLESWYKEVPGQWYGIFLLRGSNYNSIKHAVIRNAIYGVSVGSVLLQKGEIPNLSDYYLTLPDLKLENTIIENSYASGIFGFRAIIIADNCLVFNCGESNAQLVFGGIYDFHHVTLANYSSTNIDHKSPVVQLGNFAVSNQVLYSENLFVTFTNSIIYGGLDDELKNDTLGTGTFNSKFDHCLLKTTFNTADTNYINIIKNSDPVFVNTIGKDYKITSASPCIDKGKTTSLTTDLEEKLRDSKPDIGAYEFAL